MKRSRAVGSSTRCPNVLYPHHAISSAQITPAHFMVTLIGSPPSRFGASRKYPFLTQRLASRQPEQERPPNTPMASIDSCSSRLDLIIIAIRKAQKLPASRYGPS